MKNVLLSVVLLGIAAQANAGLVTDQVIDKVIEAKEQGERPVVVLDLDDTLFDSRTRKAIIFREYAYFLMNEGRDERIARILFNLKLEDYHYGVTDTLIAAGIAEPHVHEELVDFWKERFFTNKYVARDLEIPGGADFVQSLVRHGAKVVYLTGRDTPGMRKGTLESLKKRGFPEAVLMTKPVFEMDDTEFKKQAFREIRCFGKVVAVFENEPRNLNVMIDEFSDAQAVFLDTLHSDRPDQPNPNADVISDYL